MRVANIDPFNRNPIWALADLKFPEAKVFSENYFDNDASPERQELKRQVEAYIAGLEKLPKTEIDRLVSEAKDERQRNIELRHQVLEERAPHNADDAKVDINFWANLPFWDINEAIILSTGRDPRKINLGYVDKLFLASPYKKTAEERREVFRRLLDADVIKFRDTPLAFTSQAEAHGIDFPKELAEHIAKRFYQQLDKSAPVETKKKYQSALTKERDSLLKLVLGMAIEQYGYQPNAMRNEATRNIERDLEEAGFPLSEDTIRKYLRMAKRVVIDGLEE